jgi:hypothetical protein
LGFGHKEISSDVYDLLVARQDAFWHLTPKPGAELDKVLVAGHEADGTTLKLCVARLSTGWLVSSHGGYHPGKSVHGKCNIGFGGQEVSADDFYLVAFGSRPAARGANGAPDGGTPDAATPATAQEKQADSGARATLPAALTTAPGKLAHQ